MFCHYSYEQCTVGQNHTSTLPVVTAIELTREVCLEVHLLSWEGGSSVPESEVALLTASAGAHPSGPLSKADSRWRESGFGKEMVPDHRPLLQYRESVLGT